MQQKSELLSQLKIDREEGETVNGISVTSFTVGLILALVLGGGLGYWLKPADKIEVKVPVEKSVSSAASQQNASQSPAATSAKRKAAEAILNASGYITARRMATVSAEIMGRLASVDVEEGMFVKQGQILARIDDSRAQVAMAYAKAQLKSLQERRKSTLASLEEARRNYQRLSKLKGGRYSSEAQLSQAETDIRTLSANLSATDADIEAAKIEIKRQQKNLDDHIIRAPFAGVVTVKNAQPGEIIAPSSAGGGFTRTGICTIVDMDSLEIEVDVNESYIGRVSPGQKVIANLDAYPDWDIPATVIAIIPTADRAKATVRVRIGIDKSDPRILPDMGIKVAFFEHNTR